MADFGELVKETTDEEKRKQVQDSFNAFSGEKKKEQKKPSAYDLSSIGDAISRRFASLKKGG